MLTTQTKPAPAARFEAAGGPIRRMTADDIDPWMVRRLDMVWPGSTAARWRSLMTGFSSSNDYLAVCNDSCVMLAERKPHPMAAKPMVWVVFAFSRETAEGDWLVVDRSRPLIQLYMHCRRWLTDMGGERMICGLCDDLRSDTIESAWVGKQVVDGGRAIYARPYQR